MRKTLYIRKRPFSLIEVLICIALVGMLLIPMLYNASSWMQKERISLAEIEMERWVENQYAKSLEQLSDLLPQDGSSAVDRPLEPFTLDLKQLGHLSFPAEQSIRLEKIPESDSALIHSKITIYPNIPTFGKQAFNKRKSRRKEKTYSYSHRLFVELSAFVEKPVEKDPIETEEKAQEEPPEEDREIATPSENDKLQSTPDAKRVPLTQ